MQKIDVGFKEAKQVLHIADIHIRNYKRHDEYRSVFKKLYEAVEALPEHSLVYVAGDIVHNKIDMSPELIMLTSEFLRNLADRRPTIFIRGNHDMNLNNMDRLDALRPIYDSLKHPNLHYLDRTEVYDIANIAFSVFDIADDPKNYIKADLIPDDRLKVALFHGAVDSSMTDAGFKVKNLNHSVSMFGGYDLVLLGDIHKHQYLDINKRIHYPGSLLQQNFGESYENHGYTTWNINDLSSSFNHIHNDFGFYTITITDGLLPDISDIPRFPRLRIRTTNTTDGELKSIMKEIRKSATFSDAMIIKLDKISGLEKNRISQVLTNDVRDVEYQNELIEEFVERNYSPEPEILSRIKNINRSLNKDLKPVEISRNIFWKPKTLTFSNMFSYGEDNIIDFEKASGLMGLFAANHSGKSAILDTLSFCLFDKCSRTKKAEDVMNNKSLSFSCVFNFEIDGVDYFIERKAKRVKSGKSNVRVDVNFWMIGEDHSVISLNGEQRRDTNKNIRGLVGTYEDFELTTLSVQNDGIGFINKSQTERKDILSQFMDITIFEEIYAIASDEIRDVQVLLRDFRNTDYDVQLSDEESEYNLLQSKHTELQQIVSDLEIVVKNNNLEIIEESKRLKPTLENLDIDLLITRKTKLVGLRDSLVSDISSLDISKASHETELTSKSIELAGIDVSRIKKGVKSYFEHSGSKSKLEAELQSLKIDVRQKIKMVDDLNNHSYDPNCTHCIDNPLVSRAQKVKDELPQDMLSATNIKEQLADIQNDIDLLEPILEEQSSLDLLLLSISDSKSNINQVDYRKSKVELQVAKLDGELITVRKDIANYHKNETDIENNKIVQLDIESIQETLVDNEKMLSIQRTNSTRIFSSLSVSATKIESIEASIEKASDLENKLKAYEFYLEAIKRDGIPYELISQTLPFVEEEVNIILSQIVEFKIKFETDGKNILTYIQYDKSSWPLEMTSGMEKFISSLAIRVALINVSNLPRPNFLAIDEGFGNLDSDNLNSMFMLFDYLKTEFNFIMVISHLDALKDASDGLFEINVDKGFSKIVF
mgnify:FL=1